ACGNERDDDCDGQVDEGCNVALCPVDPDSPVTVTASCMTARTGARTLIWVDVLDRDGNPMRDVTVAMAAQPALQTAPAARVGADSRFRQYFYAGNSAQRSTVRLTVDCGNGGPPVALNTTPVLDVVPLPAPGDEVVTGGCATPQGNFVATVTAADTGLPIEGAVVLVGPRPGNPLQTRVDDGALGLPGAAPNTTTTNAAGVARLHDYGDYMDDAVTVTVGAEGYEYVTLVDLPASVAHIPLRPIDPPVPPTATLQGRLTDFNNLNNDGQTDAGLVLAPFDLELLSRLAIPRLLARYDCWDPITDGIAGGLVPALTVPGNMFVPQQRESVFGLPVTVQRHEYLLDGVPLGEVPLVGLAGKLPTDDVVRLASGGASLTGILDLLTFRELGVLRRDVAGDAQGVNLPLAIDLVPNATCELSNLPAGASALCATAGDWSGADGTGQLFPMGLASGEANNGAARLEVTTVPQAGPFAGVGYLAAAVGLFSGDQVPAGLENAAVAVIDRESIGPMGGALRTDAFFGATPLRRNELSFLWEPVAGDASPPVDVCQIEVVRIVRSIYDPGQCSPNLADTREVPVWTAFVGGDPGEITLPVLPGNWPRGASAGFVDPRQTPEDDRLEMRVVCSHLGLTEFRYGAADFSELVDALTHLSLNQRPF
ncbi:MAG: hypothetical protein KC613_06985, partial [Myxococcales bacterium]|nr:hypothetical protein [Myxococcales bacterium]